MARELQEPSFTASVARNVHLYDNDGRYHGGVYQNGSLTNQRMYNMCSVFLKFSPPNAAWKFFNLNNDGSTGQQLQNNGAHLIPGRYIILRPDSTPISVSLDTDSFPRRILSRTGTSSLTPRRNYFRRRVRSRDNHCMISGRANPMSVVGDYTDFDAAHIFPYAREGEWRTNNFRQFVMDNAPDSCIGSSKIHSPQNGLLLSAGLHHSFDAVRISVNPDDNYRVISFVPDNNGVDGRALGFQCRDPQTPDRVSDDLLRWHFRMGVLANMRGPAVEPTWEMDFPEGDMMGEITKGPDAVERMETELFHRLGPGEAIR